jgi:hypothetical protein
MCRYSQQVGSIERGGADKAALLRLWREKRGAVEPEDLTGNLIVQLGLVAKPLNRHWFERNTRKALTGVQRHVKHPALRWPPVIVGPAFDLIEPKVSA